MKVRSGFVSNSSSSSFILKGFLVNKEDFSKKQLMETFGYDMEEIPRQMEKYNCSEEDIIHDEFYEFVWNIRDNIFIGSSTEDGNPNDDVYMIGEIVTTLDDMDYDCKELTLEPSAILIEIKEKLGIDSPMKLICTTRCC